MGLKFRKSFKIAPGVRVNLGKKSSSVSFGGKGAKFTVNSKGRRTTTVGIPGTGLSYSSSSGGAKKKRSTSKKTAGRTYSASSKGRSTRPVATGIPPKSAGVPLPVLLAIVFGAFFLMGGFIAFVGIMAWLSADNEPIDDLEATAISANDFASKFSADEAGAREECRNNIYEITGVFESVDEDMLLISSDVIAEYSNTYELTFEFAEDQIAPDNILPGCPVTIKGRFKRVSDETLVFNGAIFISQGEIELFGTYDANELAQLIDSDEEFEDSLKGRYIQITGSVKESSWANDEIHIAANFEHDGWYQCDMLEASADDVEPGDLATIQGRVTSTWGHCNLDNCQLISVEEPTSEPPTEPPTTTPEPTEEEYTPPVVVEHTYIINPESGKFHRSDCHTIKGSTDMTKYTGTKEELKAKGYSPCGVCEP